MDNLIKVKGIFYQNAEDRKYPNLHTGLILELEDGRVLTHAQDGFIMPFQEEGELLRSSKYNKPQKENQDDETDGN